MRAGADNDTAKGRQRQRKGNRPTHGCLNHVKDRKGSTDPSIEDCSREHSAPSRSLCLHECRRLKVSTGRAMKPGQSQTWEETAARLCCLGMPEAGGQVKEKRHSRGGASVQRCRNKCLNRKFPKHFRPEKNMSTSLAQTHRDIQGHHFPKRF